MRAVLLILLLLASCASRLKPTDWYIKDVAVEKRVWRYCHKSKDGGIYHNTGFCYWTQSCYKTWIGGEECKSQLLHCPFGDIKCLEKHKWPGIRKGGNL